MLFISEFYDITLASHGTTLAFYIIPAFYGSIPAFYIMLQFYGIIPAFYDITIL
jgi:hypothetical protein